MEKVIFPDPLDAPPDGLLAIGGQIDIPHLLAAYASGIFPWPTDTLPSIPWFSPDPRFVITPANYHIGKTLKKILKKCNYTFSFNSNFSSVIDQCSLVKRNFGTWITPQLIRGFTEAYHQNLAYSFEAWEGKNLVAGLFGFTYGSYLTAESLFSLQNNGGKLLLYYFLEHLKNHHIPLLDIQTQSPIAIMFGAVPMPRKIFIGEVKRLWAQPRSNKLFVVN